MKLRFAAGWVTALLLGLSACGGSGGDAAIAPWALGEQPNFSGTIVDWAKGDAIAPGEGALFASVSPDIDVGFGQVAANGSFTFGLQRIAPDAAWLAAPVEECPEMSVANPQQKVASVDVIEVLDLYEDGKHARPGGAVLILTRPFSPTAEREGYSFVYASAAGAISGSCSFEGYGVSLDLDLRQGWNSVRIDTSMSGMSFTTAAIPSAAKWYFVNPLTVPAE